MLTSIFSNNCGEPICPVTHINPLVGVLIFIIAIFTLLFLILRITKKIKVNRIIIALLLILNILFLNKFIDVFYWYSFDAKLSIILITNYIIFLLYFFSANDTLSFKEILKKKEYKMNFTFIASYIIIFIFGFTFFELGMKFANGRDLVFICLLYLIRVYSYIYIHSFAEQIEEKKPMWITQFNDAYELAKKKEKKELFIWIYIIVYTLGIYINKHKILSTIIFIIIFGPYLLISVEFFRIANSIRKILKKYNFYNYNVWLGVVAFIQVFLISILIAATMERFKSIISMF